MIPFTYLSLNMTKNIVKISSSNIDRNNIYIPIKNAKYTLFSIILILSGPECTYFHELNRTAKRIFYNCEKFLTLQFKIHDVADKYD